MPGNDDPSKLIADLRGRIGLMNDSTKRLTYRKNPKTRYWFDWEFFEGNGNLEHVSLGMVCEDGREFYRENADAIWGRANPWVRDHVLPHLHGRPYVGWEEGSGAVDGRVPDESHPDVVPLGQIAMDLKDFVNAGQHVPEFWGYYSDTDWVLLYRLYGGMLDLPRSWPQFCLDVMQECYLRGVMDPKRTVPLIGTEHNALDDARWTYQLFKFLSGEE